MAKADKTDKGDYKGPEPKDSVHDTFHKITLNGHDLHYLATAGTLVLREDDGKPLASIFFVFYSKVDGPNAKAADPVGRSCFASTAGPARRRFGCTWGHSGRKRFACRTMVSAPTPPYSLIDNEFTLLDATDLVFIDPVSTGFKPPRVWTLNAFMDFRRTSNPSATSFNCSRRVTAAGGPQNISPAKGTAPLASPACRGISKNATACT